jgi:hypothetical protein
MSVKVVFGCDHKGCMRTFTVDSAHTEENCPGDDPPSCGGNEVPMNLNLVSAMLMDRGPMGGGGWEFTADKCANTNIYRTAFCPDHADDVKRVPGYDAMRHPHGHPDHGKTKEPPDNRERKAMNRATLRMQRSLKPRGAR